MGAIYPDGERGTQTSGAPIRRLWRSVQLPGDTPGQQFVNAVDRMISDNAQDVTQVSTRVDTIECKRSKNDAPQRWGVRTGWVDPAVAPEYGLQDFANTTPSQYLVRVAPLQRVEYRIEAATPGADARALLAMVESEPCTVLHRRTWSNGLVASIAILWHPGYRFRFSGNF